MKLCHKQSDIFISINENFKYYVPQKRIVVERHKRSKKFKYSIKKETNCHLIQSLFALPRLHLCDIQDVLNGVSC